MLDLFKNPNLFRFIPSFTNLFRVFTQNRALLGVVIYAPSIKTFKKSFIKKNWVVKKGRNENGRKRKRNRKK
ncbi:hypothetical protein C5S53_02545 [Methanophagales archaeon]|nr:hypothetical protein C5S53_02545 [Methanophagales archaeon]